MIHDVYNQSWRYKMKKTLLTLVAICAPLGVVNAQMNGGFEGPSANQPAPVPVQEALSMRDDAKVTLQGQIVNSLGDEKYTFKDASGEAVVEIDNEDWNGVKVTPENTVEITGEVDKEFYEKPKIDVNTIKVK